MRLSQNEVDAMVFKRFRDPLAEIHVFNTHDQVFAQALRQRRQRFRADFDFFGQQNLALLVDALDLQAVGVPIDSTRTTVGAMLKVHKLFPLWCMVNGAPTAQCSVGVQ